jgi:ABC-type transport system involved in multi-copper enzyme maturation permease subunit
MIDALRYEGVRVRTIASTYWTILVGLGLCALIALGFGLDSRGSDLPPALGSLLLTGGGEGLPFPVLGMVISLIGILATGQEYRHRMIYPTLTAIPRRSVLLGAKIIVMASLAAAAALVSVGLSWVVGSVAYGAPLPVGAAPVPTVLLGYVLLVICYAVLGVALGQLTRAIPAAVVIVLLCPLVVEPVLSTLAGLDVLSWMQQVVPYLPFGAGMRLLSTGLFGGAEVLGRWEGGAVFAGFVAVLLAIGWLLFERRDA